MKSAKCVTCGSALSGKQRRFCSLPCKNADTNNRHQNYHRQQERGLERKQRFLGETGNCCTRCGYNRNLAALTWHHLDPAQKLFSLDIRAMSNRSESELRREMTKCIVLCANCHAETHFPQMARNTTRRRSVTSR